MIARILCTTLASALSLASACVLAQGYPSKPVRIIVPTSPGGVNDLVTRLLSPRLGEALGQAIVVENRAGADTMIGTEMAAKAQPDGYTLLSVFDNFPLNELLAKNVPYRALKDFAPITLIIRGPQVLISHPGLGARDLPQFLSIMRAKGGAANYSTAGVGSSSHLAVELFKIVSGTAPLAVHLKGGAPAMTELVAGRVDMMIVALGGNAYAQIKAGKVLPLAVSSLKRHPEFPDVPALAETFAGFETGLWLGMVAPLGTPADIVRRLNAEVVRVVQAAEVRGKLEAQYYEVVGSTPEAFARWMASEYEKWGRVIREQKITLD